MCEYYHIVPWYNSAEWHKVYDVIYSPTSNKQEALNLLLMWKARCPSLPSGIESTLSLLQVHVQDLNNSDDIANDQLLRLAYSSAVMRFVNHMLDTETAKGSSLYQAAKNLGVPDWIVDLRHDTAHSNILPSVILLRNASIISLKWLQKNYWDKHKQCIQDYTCGQKEIDSSDENKIAALISFCSSLSICAHSNIIKLSDIHDPSLRESIVNDARDLLGDLIDLSNLKTVAIRSLINMMNIKSKKILKTNNAISHLNKALLGEDSLILSLELLDFKSKKEFKSRNKLSASYVQCFEVLLTFLHTNDLLLEFLLALIKMTQCCGDNRTNKTLLAALWVSEIMAALKKSKQFIDRAKMISAEGAVSNRKEELKLLYRHWFPNEKVGSLILDLQKPVPSEFTTINFVHPIISSYNPYLTYFVRDLLNLVEPHVPKSVSEKICTLAKLISAPDKFPTTLSSKIYTVDDLKDDDTVIISPENSDNEIDAFIKVNNIVQDDSVTGIWKLASKEHNWTSCPIGQLPWP